MCNQLYLDLLNECIELIIRLGKKLFVFTGVLTLFDSECGTRIRVHFDRRQCHCQITFGLVHMPVIGCMSLTILKSHW